jgi:hypothetical protein
MRFSRLMLAASGLATVALLGSSAVANAAGTVNGPIFNKVEAGYQIHSTVPFNEVRTTIHVPAGSSTSPFIALQETVNGGKTFAIGLLNVKGSYFLAGIKGLVINGSTGVPFVDGINLIQPVFLPTLGAPVGTPLFTSATGGSVYVELHYSTKHHLVQFIEGPTETDNAVLNIGPSGSVGFGFSGTFNAPAIENVNFTKAKLQSPSTPQSSFTRSGVTEPAGHNVGGIAGTRVTFDFFATNEAVATAQGGAPTISANQITLEPSPALPGVGSAFGIITGPEI